MTDKTELALDPTALAAAREALDALHRQHAAKGTLPGYSIIVPSVIEAYLDALSPQQFAESAKSSAEPVAWRDETEAEHIARDIKEGRFPHRSARQKRPAIDDAWDRIRDDGQLDRARGKLSMHELRRIIKHAVDAHVQMDAALSPASTSAEPVAWLGTNLDGESEPFLTKRAAEFWSNGASKVEPLFLSPASTQVGFRDA